MSEYAKNSDLFINVATGEYPYTLSKIKKENTNVFFGPNIPHGVICALGYSQVLPSEKPEYDVLIEGKPCLIDGVYYQTWTGRDFTPEEREVNLNNKKNEIKNTIIEKYNLSLMEGYYDAETSFHIGLTESDLSVLRNRYALIELGFEGEFIFKSKDGKVFSFDKEKTLSIIKGCLMTVKNLDELVITYNGEIDSIDDSKKLPDSSVINARFSNLIHS